MRSRIAPMKKIARTLRSRRALILNYFRARKQFSSGVVEVSTTRPNPYENPTASAPEVILAMPVLAVECLVGLRIVAILAIVLF